MLGESRVALLPSSYRRAVKYGQLDASNEIMRTDTLTRSLQGTLIVTYPDALAEKVNKSADVADRSVKLKVGENYDLGEVEHRLLDLGFRRRDYVYEPGEYAIRGSLLDVYSFTGDLPLRIDFFGDEVDSIRTFELQSQLSKEQRTEATLINATAEAGSEGSTLVPFTDYLPADTALFTDDLQLCLDFIDRAHAEGFTSAARSISDDLPDPTRLLATAAEIAPALLAMQRFQQKAAPALDARRRMAHIDFDTAPSPSTTRTSTSSAAASNNSWPTAFGSTSAPTSKSSWNASAKSCPTSRLSPSRPASTPASYAASRSSACSATTRYSTASTTPPCPARKPATPRWPSR